MKIYRFFILIFLPGLTLAGADVSGVGPASARHAVIEKAKAILKPAPDSVFQLKEGFVDPFVGAGSSQPAVKVDAGKGSGPAVPQNDRELLALLATKITASGIITIDNVPILLSHQKKMKIGDTITINFGGSNYAVILSGIEKNSFTLRLNQEEITRPIK